MKKTPLYLLILSLLAISCVKQRTVTKKVLHDDAGPGNNSSYPPNDWQWDNNGEGPTPTPPPTGTNDSYINSYSTGMIVLKGSEINRRGSHIFWSSRYDLPSYLSQSSLYTDSRLHLQVVAVAKQSRFDSKCSYDTLPYDKIRVRLRVRAQNQVGGQECFLDAKLGTNGNKSGIVSYYVPQGTSDPLAIEVTGIGNDYYCSSRGNKYSPYCPYADMNASAYMHDCIAFEIRYATDDTKDLSGDMKECTNLTYD